VDQGTVVRFWAKVAKSDGCWIWIGARNQNGYGNFGDSERVLKAHRVAYQLLIGPIPDGLELDHRCRIRACVNPSHLEPVTHEVNCGRRCNSLATATRCRRGHELDEANTAVVTRTDNGKVRRCCRACFRLEYHERRIRSAAAPAPKTDGGLRPMETDACVRAQSSDSPLTIGAAGAQPAAPSLLAVRA
jgi:hypothetical protein